MLNFGWQTPHNMTLSGTMRSKGRIAKKISTQMMVDSASVAQALDSAEFLANYGFTPENVFALILPDTYQMYWTASVEEIFDRLKKEYDAFWTAERDAKAKAQGLSRMQVSVLASIVSGETLKDFEYQFSQEDRDNIVRILTDYSNSRKNVSSAKEGEPPVKPANAEKKYKAPNGAIITQSQYDGLSQAQKDKCEPINE
jgi:hypothetical protein